VEKDEIAARAIRAIFGDAIESLGWTASDETADMYLAKVLDVDGTMLVSVLSDGGAILAPNAFEPPAFFVCGCGALLRSRAYHRRAPVPTTDEEIARLPEDPNGPAAVCSACAHGRVTLPSPVPTLYRAPPHPSP
jgi:hypothetical protein